MRPRKTILVVAANEQQRSVWKFLLEVRGYRALLASDAPSALALHALGVDLVLGVTDGMLREWAQLAERMKAARTDTAILLLTRVRPGRIALLAPAANMVLDGASPTIELMERVRCCIARKRGPRKMLALVPAMVAGD